GDPRRRRAAPGPAGRPGLRPGSRPPRRPPERHAGVPVTHPAYGVLRPVTPTAAVMLEDNPGSMTLDGTNTWILRGPDAADRVVVDPGYEDVPHLTRVADNGPVSLILITHHHPDHVQGAPWLAERTGAPIRAFDPSLCRDASALSDGE